MRAYLQIFIIIIFFSPLWINAQIFPVQVTPQVIPPYSLKLSDYNTSTSEKLILNLLFTDVREFNRQVRLKVYIENNAGLSIRSNDFVVGTNPIFLDGGIPLRLSNVDLQPYFSLQNLLGVSPQQYSTPLPEGLYQFCFEVYDVLTDVRLSRKSCVPVYLVLNDPPFLNLPIRGEQVLIKEPQNIIFQWTPRHLNATNVSYEFTLTELWDNQMDPQTAFLIGRPLYQTTTFATTLLYGPAEPPLLPDKKYGWRVRAMISDGISETSVFKNDGFSEIYYFIYTGSCAEPELIIADAKSNTSERIQWQGVDHNKYEIQYRKKATANKADAWFKKTTVNELITIANLEPGTTYEFRVGGQCIDNGPYTYSQIYNFTTTLPTDTETTFNCGILPEIVITNQKPLQQLMINEKFTAGDFPVTVKEVVRGNGDYVTMNEINEAYEGKEDKPTIEEAIEENAQDGTYSGWGYIVVPYLDDTKIKVSFENIKINTDYQLIDGVVETDYDKNWGGLTSVNDIIDVFEGDNDVRTIHLDYDIAISDISVADDGTIEIKHPVSGTPRREPGGDDVTIIDRSGDIFHVDADGNITEGGQMAPGGPINTQNTDGVTSSGEVTQLTAQGIKVEFINDTSYSYGYDWIPQGQEQPLEKYYKRIKDTQGNLYPIINKSVGNRDTDIIKAKVTISDSNISISDLVIKTIHGENVDYIISGDNEITLTLKGYYSFEHENIYATLQPEKNGTDKQTIAGVFSQWHLADKAVNVTIVPVNMNGSSMDPELGSKINKIFKQASVTFNVTVAPEMYVNKSQIGVSETGVVSNYTADQKDIINTYKTNRPVDRKSYYVFVFGKDVSPSRSSVAGFMPLKRQFGFVFSGNLSKQEEGKSSLAGTLAHELGHGVFALQHPFKKLNTTTGGTDWLMDYGSGMRLSHLDWAQIHNPEFRLYLFQDEGDAALTISAITPFGDQFTYDGEGTIVFTDEMPDYSNGAVFAIFENDKLYKWNEAWEDYMHGNESLTTDDRDVERDAVIQLYWHKGSCEANEIYETSYYTIAQNYLILNSSANRYEVKLDLNVTEDSLPNNIVYSGKAGCSTDSSCDNVVIADLQREINALKAISDVILIDNNTALSSTPDLIDKVNALNMCGLKQLSYEDITKLLITLMLQNDFDSKHKTERAIVKLMQLIPEDKNTDFFHKMIAASNGLALRNTVAKAKNVSFPEFDRNEDSVFITGLSRIVFALSNNEKWNVLNIIIRNQFENLEDHVALALQNILMSLNGQTEDQVTQIPASTTLFIDMLRDANIPNSLSSYKIIYDIAGIRNSHREQFRNFTIADYLVLVKNPNYGSIFPNEEPTSSQAIGPADISWLLPFFDVPSFQRHFGLLLGDDYILEDNYLNKYVFWYRYLLEEGHSKETFNRNPSAFLDMFYEQLLYYLEVGNESNAAFWNRIGTVTCDNIAETIRHINKNENAQTLRGVNDEAKFSFLQSFFECSYFTTTGTDALSHNLEHSKNSLMKVLGSFSPSNEDILKKLEGIGLDVVDRKLNTGDFSEFSVWLGMQIMSSGSGRPVVITEDIISYVNQKDIPFFDTSKFLQLEANMFEFNNFSGKLDDNKVRIGGVDLEYDQIVLVHISGSFDFLGQRQKRGEILLIPAIQAYAMSESNQEIVVWNRAFFTLDVASVAFPILGGGIKVFRLAGHYVPKTILASEIAASSASALVTALNSDAIDPVLRSRIQIASMFTSVPAFFVKAPTNVQLAALRADIDEKLNALNKSGRLDDTPTELLQRSYRGGNGTVPGNVMDRIPDELHSVFRQDFPNPSALNNASDEFIQGYIKFRNNPANRNIGRCN